MHAVFADDPAENNKNLWARWIGFSEDDAKRVAEGAYSRPGGRIWPTR